MKFISVPGLSNQINIFEKTDNLCPKCSYPIIKGQCKSCNIFRKNKDYTGGKFYFEKNISVGEYFHMKESEKPSEKSKNNMTWLILNYKSELTFLPFCVELIKLKVDDFLKNTLISKENFILCSVPDYESRTYKKCEELCKLVSKKTNINYLPILKKVKETKKQHQLKSIKEKFENIKGIYEINKDYFEMINNKYIILLDDVVSSMASINECSKILKEARVNGIYIFSLGRNILPEKAENLK